LHGRLGASRATKVASAPMSRISSIVGLVAGNSDVFQCSVVAHLPGRHSDKADLSFAGYSRPLFASITGGDDHRNIGARPDLAQQVEPILLVKPQIENDEIKLAFGQMTHQLLMSGCRACCGLQDSQRPYVS
jgi:hypothetical protein